MSLRGKESAGVLSGGTGSLFSGAGESGFYRVAGKRAFDLVAAILMLTVAAPLILLLIVVVAIEGGQPIFAHTRIGRSGQPFRCLKIRTMRRDSQEQLARILATDPVAAAEWAAEAKLTSDPRVTRIGGFLRETSLDELPQLVNVLKGEMSLVGPRPVDLPGLDMYGKAAESYESVKPGLTGPWQVSGRNELSYAERVELDVEYAKTYDFVRDLKIVARTGLVVLRRDGI